MSGAVDVAPAQEDAPGAGPQHQRRRVPSWLRYSLPGLAVAVVFVCLSLSPSLLPRSGITQGLVCGITGAIGYGLGVVGAWAWRALADGEARVASRRSCLVCAVVAVVALVGAMAFGRYWQDRLRTVRGVPLDG